MKRINVTSNSIKTVGYDQEQRHLEIEFRNGRLYRYQNFPERLHRQLLNANSLGNFFHTVIRPVFPAVELEPNVEGRAKDEEPSSG